MLAEQVAAGRESVVIAHSDACRIQGYREAIKRVNLAAEQGVELDTMPNAQPVGCGPT